MKVMHDPLELQITQAAGFLQFACIGDWDPMSFELSYEIAQHLTYGFI
jgi:hypothetical protein